MKFINAFKLALRNVKSNSLRRNIFIIIIMLFSITVSILFFIYETALFAEKVTKEISEYKTVVINSDGLTDENIEFLKKYKNKNIVKKSFEAIPVFGNLNLDKIVVINEIVDKHTPDVVEGRYPQKEDEMICPNKMPIGQRTEGSSSLKDTKINDIINFKIINISSTEEFNHDFNSAKIIMVFLIVSIIAFIINYFSYILKTIKLYHILGYSVFKSLTFLNLLFLIVLELYSIIVMTIIKLLNTNYIAHSDYLFISAIVICSCISASIISRLVVRKSLL